MFWHLLLVRFSPLASLLSSLLRDDRDRQILALRQQVLILQRQLGRRHQLRRAERLVQSKLSARGMVSAARSSADSSTITTGRLPDHPNETLRFLHCLPGATRRAGPLCFNAPDRPALGTLPRLHNIHRTRRRLLGAGLPPPANGSKPTRALLRPADQYWDLMGCRIACLPHITPHSPPGLCSRYMRGGNCGEPTPKPRSRTDTKLPTVTVQYPRPCSTRPVRGVRWTGARTGEGAS
jgi:hypothetical protein